ncbi:hypothetical protein CDL15_Pgr004287 [Punica granatum]|uniref:Uncharacterized protein n=1 Tax=Punica granatum TaxID=22663 RepID=A0A218XGK1_PUNGR|nr:hypothetical protein CDL15_Pgr004287 [Punica granatum]
MPGTEGEYNSHWKCITMIMIWSVEVSESEEGGQLRIEAKRMGEKDWEDNRGNKKQRKETGCSALSSSYLQLVNHNLFRLVRKSCFM